MKTIHPKEILIDAICGVEIADEIASAIISEIEKSFLKIKKEKKANTQLELKKSIEKGLRANGPGWLKMLIEKQDQFRVKH